MSQRIDPAASVFSRRHRHSLRSALALLGAVLLSPAVAHGDLLTYVDSSQGLTPPTMEGGRTVVEFCDVNVDGDLDLVSIGDHGSPYVNTDEHGIMVWFGNGQGTWNVVQTGNFGYGGIALGDLNGDGLVDAAYGMHHAYSSNDLGDQILEAALGDGTGINWTAWDDGLASNGESWGMFDTDLADIDEDGDLDLGANSFGADAGLHVYRNNGDGTWTQTWGFLHGNSTDDCLFGDVNADGHADFVAAHQAGTVFFGDGLGGFVNADGNLPPGGSLGRSGISLGDVDNDGDLDLAFKVTGGAFQVWLWNGDGTWTNASAGLPTSGIAATQLADMNGDGWCDAVGLGNGILRIWLGNGGSAWTLATTMTFPSPGSWSALRVGGDVDHNGRPDLATVTEEGGTYTSYNHQRVFRETSVPADLSARFVSPRGGERFIAGSVRFVDWMTAVPSGQPALCDLDLSLTGPTGPWIPVAADLPDGGRFQWTVPLGLAGMDAFLRVRATVGAQTAEALTPRAFTILPPPSTSVQGAAGLAARGRIRVIPNPSSGLVRINDSFGIRTEVARVFDSGGRMVQSLVPGQDIWEGRDLSGKYVPPGVYYLRMGRETVRLIRCR